MVDLKQMVSSEGEGAGEDCATVLAWFIVSTWASTVNHALHGTSVAMAGRGRRVAMSGVWPRDSAMLRAAQMPRRRAAC